MAPIMGGEGGTVLAPVRFGEFVLDEAGFALRRHGQPVPIEPRALKLLLPSTVLCQAFHPSISVRSPE